MSDLLQKITEQLEDGRITEQRDPGKILPQFDDWVDSGCQESRPRTIADNSPSGRKDLRPNKTNKP